MPESQMNREPGRALAHRSHEFPQRHNLPVALTSFIGRDPEIAMVQQLLTERRFVTLAGSGGVGKTRLALEATLPLVSTYPGGVWWIDVSTVSDGVLVPGLIASALAIADRPGAALQDALVEVLRMHGHS